MKIKIVTALLLSAILSGCAVYPNSSSTVSKKKTTTKKYVPPKKTVSKKPAKKVVTKKTYKPVTNIKPSKQSVKPVVKSEEVTRSNSGNIKPKANVVTNEVKSINYSLPPMKNGSSVSRNHFDLDKSTLMNCEKQGLCMKELVIVDSKMYLKVEMPDDIYLGLKNKDNAVTYYNNDVKIFKKNPDLYLKKYGLIHKKYTNAKGMLLNLPEVQIQDLFSSKVFVRFKPYN